MDREQEARELLAREYERAGYSDEAAAFRAGKWTCHDHPAYLAIIAAQDAMIDRAAEVARQAETVGMSEWCAGWDDACDNIATRIEALKGQP